MDVGLWADGVLSAISDPRTPEQLERFLAGRTVISQAHGQRTDGMIDVCERAATDIDIIDLNLYR